MRSGGIHGAHVRAALLVAGLCFAAIAVAQKFPERTIRVVVPYNVGTTPDITMRLVGERLAPAWKQSIVIDNRPGAAGTVAAMEVKRGRPDGHDWFVGDIGSLVINPMFVKDLPFDPEKDFAPIMQLTRIFYYLWVSTSSPLKSVADLIAAGKAQPGKLSFGTSGTGSPQHVLWEVLMQRAGFDMLHVPFKGGSPVQVAVASGEVTIMAAGYNLLRPMMSAGKLRPLAVAAKKRDPQHPELPTVEESGGPGSFELVPWVTLMVLAGTSKSTIERIHADVAQALRHPEVNEKLLQSGNYVVADRPEELAALIVAEREQYLRVVAAVRARGGN